MLLAIPLLFGVVMATPVGTVAVEGNNGEPEHEFTLFAGKDMAVGYVDVWNDADNLYVKYVVDKPGWCLTETHLDVKLKPELDLPAFPSTGGKVKNLVPGQFEFGMEHDCLGDYTQRIPLDGWEADDVLGIAAHAVVAEELGTMCPVWMIGEKENLNEVNVLTNYADEFNWPNASENYPGDSLASQEPFFANPFYVGVNEDIEFPWNSNKARSYATDIDVKWEGNLNFGGQLTISWAPGASAFEEKIISGDGILSPVVHTAQGANVYNEGWFNNWKLYEKSIPVGQLVEGNHTFNFEHTKGDGTAWDWIKLEEPCVNYETAWAATGIGENRFTTKGNWATWFPYELKEIWEFVETVEVPAYYPTTSRVCPPVLSVDPLELGSNYKIIARGTANAGDGIEFDAQYSYRTPTSTVWTDYVNNYSSYGANLLDLYFNDQYGIWGNYSEDHVYEYQTVGDGEPATFCINDVYHINNSGYLYADIYKKIF